MAHIYLTPWISHQLAANNPNRLFQSNNVLFFKYMMRVLTANRPLLVMAALQYNSGPCTKKSFLA